MTDPLVSVRDLEKHYPITEGILDREVGRVRAVDGVSFDVAAGEVFGLVGESGCGKSTLAHTLLRLEEPTGGRILFDGEDVTAYDDEQLRRFRRRVQITFQDPDSSLDPRRSVGESVGEPLRIQGLRDPDRRREIVANLLERVGLTPEDADRYPHEFSGGQKQRIGLARALAVNPDLLVADEPVSALDISTKAAILSLLATLKEEFDLTILLITHDISVVRQLCDRTAVMYLGEFVETGPTAELFADPRHPYTEGLLASVPTPDPGDRGLGSPLSGTVPSASDPPSGCRFHTRCPAVIPSEDLDVDRDAFRRVVQFRARLAAGEVTPDGDRGAGDRSLRDRHDLPSRLADPAADDALTEALAALEDGDAELARETLADAFPSPCVAESPPLYSCGSGRESACHLEAEAYDRK